MSLPKTTHAGLWASSLLFVVVLCASNCRSEKEETEVPGIRHVILISIDTLRPDYLGCYNRERNRSPNLDRFAAENILFTDATAQSSTTAPSHKSILYSLYPSVHKTTLQAVPRETVDSPLEILKSRGFKTAAFVGGGQLHAKSGVEKGFDLYRSAKHSQMKKHGKSNLNELEQESFAWLDENKKDPFFLFLHTYEVHCPYAPSDPYASELAGWYTGEIDPRGKCGDNFYNDHPMTEQDYQYLRDLYAASVRSVDDFLYRLLERLRISGIYERAIIVVLSDHGESLGERGYVGHNQLYDVQLKIPLMMRIPGITSRRVDLPVESIDVMPTVFAFLGAGDSFPFQGRDLSGVLLKGNSIEFDRLIISESRKRIRVRRGNWSAHFGHRGGNPELYDLSRDPHEVMNLANENPDLLRRLWNSYEAKRRESETLAARFVVGPESNQDLDPETQEQLKALGYLGE